MGTRADFYNENTWLGSVAWDGYEWHEEQGCPLMQSKTQEEFVQHVANTLINREDATFPSEGWPWPWEDSKLTDFAYVFENGVKVYNFGKLCNTPDPSVKHERDWPNMKRIQNVTFGNRSGLIIVEA